MQPVRWCGGGRPRLLRVRQDGASASELGRHVHVCDVGDAGGEQERLRGPLRVRRVHGRLRGHVPAAVGAANAADVRIQRHAWRQWQQHQRDQHVHRPARADAASASDASFAAAARRASSPSRTRRWVLSTTTCSPTNPADPADPAATRAASALPSAPLLRMQGLGRSGGGGGVWQLRPAGVCGARKHLGRVQRTDVRRGRRLHEHVHHRVRVQQRRGLHLPTARTALAVSVAAPAADAGPAWRLLSAASDAAVAAAAAASLSSVARRHAQVLSVGDGLRHRLRGRGRVHHQHDG